MPPIGQKEWLEEGKRLFGLPATKWKFQCPVCKHVQTMEDFTAIGAEPCSAYQECIGRYIPGSQAKFLKSPKTKRVGPCDYAAYGLFHLGREVAYEDGGTVHVFPYAMELPL